MSSTTCSCKARYQAGDKSIKRVKTGVSKITGKPLYRYMSAKKSAQGSKNPWAMSIKQARKNLGITGFEPIKKGGKLYKEAKRIHDGKKKPAKKASKKASKKKSKKASKKKKSKKSRK